MTYFFYLVSTLALDIPQSSSSIGEQKQHSGLNQPAEQTGTGFVYYSMTAYYFI